MTLIGITTGWLIWWWVAGSIIGLTVLLLLVIAARSLHARRVNARGKAASDKEIEALKLEWHDSDADKAKHMYMGNFRFDDPLSYQNSTKRHEMIIQRRYKPTKGLENESLWYTSIFMAAFSACLAVVLTLTLIPYDFSYKSWYSTSGVVTDITAIEVDAQGDSSLTGQYIVTVDSVPNVPLVMTDQRIRLYEGKGVTLLCSPKWQDWGQSTDKWECSIKDAEGLDISTD